MVSNTGLLTKSMKVVLKLQRYGYIEDILVYHGQERDEIKQILMKLENLNQVY